MAPADNPHITDIARYFNSVGPSIGCAEVCTAAQLRDLLIRLGIRTEGAVSLPAYIAALLFRVAKKPRRRPSKKHVDAESYQTSQRETAARRSREKSESGRNIGRIPPVADPVRRANCARDLAKFCTTYFPTIFVWEFSADHIDLIRQIEQTIWYGGLYVYAVYRGFGKTMLARIAAIWAALYGHAEVVPLVCSTDKNAIRSLQTIRFELQNNAMLSTDFPEVCFPINALAGNNRRADGQLYEKADGSAERTFVNFGKDEIQFPTIEGGGCNGTVITTLSLEGEIRGLNYSTPDGRSLRPRFCIIDDPQTNSSAKSPDQVEKRVDIIMRDIVMSSGHATEMAVIMPATIIENDDLVARFLDHQQHPEWVGKKVRMLLTMPSNMDLWEECGRIRNNYRESDRVDRQRAIRESAEFYLDHRQEMDAGAEAAWPECYKRTADSCEHSAIQHAMNYLLDYHEKAFWAECQNEPLSQSTGDEALTREKIITKVEPRLKRGVVPSWTDVLVASEDVHDDMLFWKVCAVRKDNFRSHIVDYGVWPKQRSAMFTQGTGKNRVTLKTKYRGKTADAAILQGLTDLTAFLRESNWACEDGTLRQVERIAIDSNYKTTMVYEFCAGDPRLLLPIKGAVDNYTSGVGFMDRTESKTTRRHVYMNGTGYKKKPIENFRGLWLYTYEANYAKTFVRDLLLADKGDNGGLTICAGDPSDHALLCSHLMGEKATYVQSVRDGWVWKPVKSGADNHWLDCGAYCCVAASVLDCRKSSDTDKTKVNRPRKRFSLAERQKSMREGTA